ncbi:beta-prism lectin domain-containing protein [Vibrio sp. V08_P9A1T1]|uniref:beta-prism lectin domain-containing protein n=1 Tax=Vibrio sp. V08_P9A1T1 TaxID=1938663 RepID=UPI000B8E4D26|nr:beta-prism lectin domain-containing protein [Vibrio sp. V08_P9A1T1]OXX27330.1 hemolysin [Vibrio sp. V08_P9A1T1]
MTSKFSLCAVGLLSIGSITASNIAIASSPSEINTQLKWSWQGSSFKPESNQVIAAPIVAQLNDDNGDGKIDENDIADIIVVTFENNKYTQGGLVRALSGIDGSELWSYNNGGIIADARYSPAVADLDGDGVVEIVTTSTISPYINILDNEGQIKKQILKSASGWRSVGAISLSDLNNDGSIDILSADGVYNYDTGLLFSLEWAPSPISFDADGDGIQEVFSNGALYKSDGSFTWQYQTNDTVWFSSVANLDSDNKPEIVVSVPASKGSAQNSSFAVLEHDGSVKWEVNNLENPGGGVQAISNFLGNAATNSTNEIAKSPVYGYTHLHHSHPVKIADDNQLKIRSGDLIDAIGSTASNMVGGQGGSLHTIDASKVRSIDVTYGKYKTWWTYGVLEMEFTLNDGSKITLGSKDSAFKYPALEWRTKEVPYLGLEWRTKQVSYWFFGWHTKTVSYLAPVWKTKTIPYAVPVMKSKATTERYTVPSNTQLVGLNVWSKPKPIFTFKKHVNAVQFVVGESINDSYLNTGIVYAGYHAVDMYNAQGSKVWSVANDDYNSGKIGVSAYDFTGDGIDEVIVQDLLRVRILDGRTGAVLATIANSSNTLWEYPVVADLEGNNNASLIVVANDYAKESAINHGVYVYESADADKPWKNATRIWNQHSFHFSNINQDGSVPTNAQPSWLTHNTYRSSTIK